MTLNMQDELRGDYLVPATMKRIWKVELDILQVLIDVCQKHGLQMWVDGGTMLGAVRHKGFIPWDDDIDVCMPRPDYDRLITLHKEFKEPYFLQSALTEEGYFRGHAQLRHSGTAAVRPSESYRHFNQGIFIDIFPLDGVPEDEATARQRVKEAHRVYRFLKAAELNILYSGRWGQVFRKLRSRRAVARQGWQNIFKTTEDLFRQTRVEDSSRWAELAFSGLDIVFERHLFDETVWLDFENIKVPVPAGYDEFLRTQYGANYMTPMKVGNYHGVLVFDTNRSYREVAPEVFETFKHESLLRLKKKLIK